MKIYSKLVRDKIPDIISARGHAPFVRRLGHLEFRAKLKLKLLEEANEVLVAIPRDTILDELADLVDVIETLTAELGSSMAEIRQRQEKKRAERGGFEHRIFLEKVDEK